MLCSLNIRSLGFLTHAINTLIVKLPPSSLVVHLCSSEDLLMGNTKVAYWSALVGCMMMVYFPG